MVQIRIVWVCVNDRVVAMLMRMRFRRRIVRSMAVPVMIIMLMSVLMLGSFMRVQMLVTADTRKPGVKGFLSQDIVPPRPGKRQQLPTSLGKLRSSLVFLFGR
jgi:hypothetical protein